MSYTASFTYNKEILESEKQQNSAEYFFDKNEDIKEFITDQMTLANYEIDSFLAKQISNISMLHYLKINVLKSLYKAKGIIRDYEEEELAHIYVSTRENEKAIEVEFDVRMGGK